MLNQAILKALKNSTHQNELFEIMEYATLPAGKLFRPRLVEAMSLDLNQTLSQNHIHLAAALELHHAYTLVHDDLPAMDNDLIRRGKPSTHAQFGEWKAILAGDALLISSFHELHKITHKNTSSAFKLFSWATGAKGLILGQFLDLGANGKLSLPEVVRIHELKTARLLQIATLGSYLLSTETADKKSCRSYLRLGREIGLCFQLLDDLSDLNENVLNEHEKDINPFLINTQKAFVELDNSLKRLKKVLSLNKLPHIEKMLSEFFEKSKNDLLKNESVISTHLNGMKLKDWISSSFSSF